ncbi:MAG: phosphate acyltransferase PlsX [Armatimonadota bacterium]|nr:phosphate acyltransferase PlsX [Armatimonadota bacterium]
MRVAIDAMGGDFAPRAVVEGAVAAARDLGIEPILVGAPGVIEGELRRLGAPTTEIVEAADVIEMHEHPAMALRRKRRSSIAVAVEQVRDGRAHAVVSAGHTGAAMGAAQLVLGRLPGIDRPAIAAVLPTVGASPVVVLDVGANVDCKPAQLAQFALMGSLYAQEVLAIASPRIGLLSNGEEETKGNALTIRAAEILRSMPIRFVGNVEGRDVLFGAADVVVCDGFVGNVMLKLGEGLVRAIREIVRAELAGWRGRLWQAYLTPLVGRARRMWRRLDYREYGGAPLLGINGVCVIAHGRSNAHAIRNAVRVAAESARHDLPARIRAAMREMRVAGGGPGVAAAVAGGSRL